MENLFVCCPRCGWKEKATIWDIFHHDDGTQYTIVVCPKCYTRVYLTKD